MEGNRKFVYKNFLSRFLSSIVLMLAALYFNSLGGYYFFFLTIIISIVLLIELYHLFSKQCLQAYFLLNLFFNFLLLISIFYNFYYIFLIVFFLSIGIKPLIYKVNNYPFIIAEVYITLPICAFLNLNGSLEGKSIIHWVFLVVWTVDISGYVFGNLFKGPKLISHVSPNKTWSGFISGILLAGILSIFFAYYIKNESYLAYFIISVVAGLFCTAGDLFESYLKRKNNIKDTSNLIPGHGGLLDRLDGFLFAILFFWIVAYFKEHFI